MCISIFTSYAQNPIYEDIQQAKNVETFNVVTTLTLANRKSAPSQWIVDHFTNPQEVYIMQYNPSVYKNMGVSVTFVVPIGQKNLQLEIQEVIINYNLTTSDGQNIMANKNIRHFTKV